MCNYILINTLLFFIYFLVSINRVKSVLFHNKMLTVSYSDHTELEHIVGI